MRFWVCRSLLICSVLALLGMSGTIANVRAQATPVAGTGGEQYTPVVQSVMSTPRWFTGSDNQVHLTYELMLINVFPVDVTVTTVDVLDAATGTSVGKLTGDALTGAMSQLTLPTTPSADMSPSSVSVVWMDIPLVSSDDLPVTIKHRLTVSVPPGLPVPAEITAIGAAAQVDPRPPVVLGPPLAGPRWVAVGSCCDGPHRRSIQAIDGGLYLAQRFAIDFNLLDEDNRLSSGDPSLNTSYPSYGQPVLAVADATVVRAVDIYEDQVAGETVGITLQNADGNHVVLDLGDGRFAFYAHLLPGSVTVKEGDHVSIGQHIGELGNSGSSSGPHLHFHVMDSPSALASDGVPYIFDAFDLTGEIPPLDEAMTYYEKQEPIPISTEGVGPRQNELPLGGDVMTFAAPSE